jgi:AraC-like DNA-binding protein
MADAPGAVLPLRFATREIPPSARRTALYELREQDLLPLAPLPDTTPEVDLQKWHLPGASVLSGTFAGIRQGGECLLGGDLFFGINVSGCSLLGQGDHEIAIGHGDAVFVDTGLGAFSVLRRHHVELIGVRVPRMSLPDDAIRADAAPPRLVRAGSAALHLLTGYLRSALSGSVLSAAPIAERVVSHVTELISLSLNPTSRPPGPAAAASVQAARLAAVKVDIARNLTDGALSAPTLAARHGISTRYLHKLFDDEEVTFGQFILDQRLSLACTLLRSPQFAARTISSIAYGAGFGDLSYFNRTFRRRYGTTPSDLRRRSDRD